MSEAQVPTLSRNSMTHVLAHRHLPHQLKRRGCSRIIPTEKRATTCTTAPDIIDLGDPSQTTPCTYSTTAVATTIPAQPPASEPELGHDKATLVGVLIPTSCLVLLLLLFLCSWCRGKHLTAIDFVIEHRRKTMSSKRERGQPRMQKVDRGICLQFYRQQIPLHGGQIQIERTPSLSSRAGITDLMPDLDLEPVVHDHGDISGLRHVESFGTPPHTLPRRTGEPSRLRDNDPGTPSGGDAVVQDRGTQGEIRWSSSEQTLRDSVA